MVWFFFVDEGRYAIVALHYTDRKMFDCCVCHNRCECVCGLLSVVERYAYAKPPPQGSKLSSVVLSVRVCVCVLECINTTCVW